MSPSINRSVFIALACLAIGATSTYAQERCTKGIPCGNTCIAANRTCRIGSSTISSNASPAAPLVPPGTQYVASSRGTTYYYVGCNGWKSLAAGNRVYFKTIEEARAAGLRPSTQAGCAGPPEAEASTAVAAAPIAAPDSLIGRCGYNRPDQKLVGPVIAVRGNQVTVFHGELGRIDITYPRDLIVRPCP